MLGEQYGLRRKLYAPHAHTYTLTEYTHTFPNIPRHTNTHINLTNTQKRGKTDMHAKPGMETRFSVMTEMCTLVSGSYVPG